MNDLNRIAVFIYACLWIVAGYFLWRAYRVGIKKDFGLIKGINGHPLNNIKNLIQPFALTELLTGAAIICFLSSVPVFALPMHIWSAFILVIGTTRRLLLIRLSRKYES